MLFSIFALPIIAIIFFIFTSIKFQLLSLHQIGIMDSSCHALSLSLLALLWSCVLHDLIIFQKTNRFIKHIKVKTVFRIFRIIPMKNYSIVPAQGMKLNPPVYKTIISRIFCKRKVKIFYRIIRTTTIFVFLPAFPLIFPEFFFVRFRLRKQQQLELLTDDYDY